MQGVYRLNEVLLDANVSIAIHNAHVFITVPACAWSAPECLLGMSESPVKLTQNVDKSDDFIYKVSKMV